MFTTRHPTSTSLPATTSTGLGDGVEGPQALANPKGCLTLAQLAHALGWPVPALVQVMQRMEPVSLHGTLTGAALSNSERAMAFLPLALRPISPDRLRFYQQVAQRLAQGEPMAAILVAPPLVVAVSTKPSIGSAPSTAGALRTQAAVWGFAQYCSLLYRTVPSSLASLPASTAAAVPRAGVVVPAVVKGKSPLSSGIMGIAHQHKHPAQGLHR